MKLTLNISKQYLIDKPLEEVYNFFDNIIASSFNNSNFTLFGNFVNVDPPIFQFMAKWFSLGRPMFADTFSTKIYVTLLNENNKTKIIINTKTNPAFITFFIILSSTTFLQLIFQNNLIENVKALFLYFGIALLTIFFDRFVKNILVANFERDCINKL